VERIMCPKNGFDVAAMGFGMRNLPLLTSTKDTCLTGRGSKSQNIKNHIIFSGTDKSVMIIAIFSAIK
jgi:hypothetical protein